MKVLTLIRGLPGSGKTTLAQKLARYAEHVEADMYFTKNGEYNFNPAYLREAHQWCQDCASRKMEAGDDVIVSNTFVRLWEMDAYLTLARTHGYTVQIIECKGRFENVHGVPADKLREMRLRWENLD